MDDTIIAVATPIGYSIEAIVRLSGSKSLPLVHQVFKPLHKMPGFKGSFCTTAGRLIIPQPRTNLPATLYIMKKPHSYTREDVVEIHTLGIPPLLDLLIRYFIKKGARLAEPGEFTRRAYLNGRIDLAQAEAVLSIIKSRNEKELLLAQQELAGHFSGQINEVSRKLRDLLARLELSLDFSDQDIEIITSKQIRGELDKLIKILSELLVQRQTGTIYKEGITAVLCGKPNVGKSSLFNRLIRKERAIVTPIAGTTRDVIESEFDLNSTRVRLFDTAGVGVIPRTTLGKLTAEKTTLMLKNVDIYLLVVDGSCGLDAADMRICRQITPQRTIVLINKSDLKHRLTIKKARRRLHFRGDVFYTSARTGVGLSKVWRYLKERPQVDKSSSGRMINLRWQEELSNALATLKGIRHINETELVALELREVLNFLGTISGITTPDDILNQIFSRFCIGK